MRADDARTDAPRAPFALQPAELRVLGCLLEKQRTTPDAYPLSLNALRLACNQKTNRDPVVEYDDALIRDALHRLERRGLTRLASGAGSRAAKHRHLLADALPMNGAEQAVMCVLMLRGAQTPGEIKQRAERMHPVADLATVHETLDGLIERGLARRLERRPGHKEERYDQLLEAREEADTAHAPPPGSAETVERGAPHPAGGGDEDLAARVARLEREVARLRERLGAPGERPVGVGARPAAAGAAERFSSEGNR